MGARLLESFRDVKRQESFAIIGIALVAFGTRASSILELSISWLKQIYPSRSASVISTSSAEAEEDEVGAN